MIKIFDCSNSSERPSSRGFGGPMMNEFVSLLHKYAPKYGALFVDTLDEADVVFTNDIFPSYVRNKNLPLVKRMDGIFWQSDLVHRNLPFIESATIADLVIFITEYSKNSFKSFYPNEFENLNYTVATHWTDPESFPLIDIKVEIPTIFSTMATNWNRHEKRINDLIKFAEMFPVTIHLIGNSDNIQLPDNIIPHGYLSSASSVYDVMKQSHAFINLTCKDAATKTVCTAINYGLPVLYAGSGGVPEMVLTNGVAINEHDSFEVLDYIPSVDADEMEIGYLDFINCYPRLVENLKTFNPRLKLDTALNAYFDRILSLTYNR